MFQTDIQKGDENETRVFPIINEVFQTEFKKTPPFALFDFKDYKTKTELEVKTISYSYGETSEVMVGYNKIVYAMKQIDKNWDMWLLFSLKDGDYLYNIKEVNTDWIRDYVGRSDRYNSKSSKYYWIPIEKLTKIEDGLMVVEL
jgi:hypothetical protein